MAHLDLDPSNLTNGIRLPIEYRKHYAVYSSTLLYYDSLPPSDNTKYEVELISESKCDCLEYIVSKTGYGGISSRIHYELIEFQPCEIDKHLKKWQLIKEALKKQK